MNATVRVLPQKGYEEKTQLLLNSTFPNITGDKLEYRLKDTPWGRVLEAVGVTGVLIISNLD